MLELKSVDDVTCYLKGVSDRSGHHAQHMAEITMTLAGCVFTFRDVGSIVRVRTYEGRTTNVIWFRRNDISYCLVYNHDTLNIDLRENNVKGPTIHSFDGTESVRSVRQVFIDL